MAMQRKAADVRRQTVVNVLAVLVRETAPGRWDVPSASAPSVTYVVNSTESGLRCTCTSGQFGRACRHVGAVRLRSVQEAAKAQARRLEAKVFNVAITAVPGERIARATATFRMNGVEYTGEGRNLIDALGNAQVAA